MLEYMENLRTLDLYSLNRELVWLERSGQDNFERFCNDITPGNIESTLYVDGRIDLTRYQGDLLAFYD